VGGILAPGRAPTQPEEKRPAGRHDPAGRLLQREGVRREGVTRLVEEFERDVVDGRSACITATNDLHVEFPFSVCGQTLASG